MTAGLYCGTYTICGFVGWMTMVCGDCWTTVICEPDFRLPAAFAFARKVWIAVMTSACWLWYASPSCDVQERFWAKLLSTDGNSVSALTLGSQVCLSTAVASALPVSVLFCSTQ